MAREKVEFPGHNGQLLAGMLERPDGAPVACALFAHCFTCSKDIAAASRISRALTRFGIAVLRFDFTGLGHSQGDFANTNFSSNVDDLVAAGDFLEKTVRAPSLLIGHSLGGAAVLVAASRMESIDALVTIGAPASAQHVEHLFSDARDQIIADDEASVTLGGRPFTIKKQFIDDLDQYTTTDHIGKLRKALLVFHSPIDATVPISEASRIYAAAKHPKSFVSLDQADHLLSRKEDSEYVADVLSSWATRYVGGKEAAAAAVPRPERGAVRVSESNRKFGRMIWTDSHQFEADEPEKVGGNNAGPDPYELLLASLGACTSMTLRMYASRKKIPLDDVEITLRHSREHLQDCEDCEQKSVQVDVIDREIILRGELDEPTRQRMLEIADRCPVHRTLENRIEIRSKLV